MKALSERAIVRRINSVLRPEGKRLGYGRGDKHRGPKEWYVTNTYGAPDFYERCTLEELSERYHVLTVLEAKMEFPDKIEDVTLDQADELLRAQAAYCRELSLGAANFCYVRAIYSEYEGRHEEAQEFYKRAANQANIAGDAEMERLYRSKIVSHDR